MILDTGFWILDIFGFHRQCVPEYPASSIQHRASAWIMQPSLALLKTGWQDLIQRWGRLSELNNTS